FDFEIGERGVIDFDNRRRLSELASTRAQARLGTSFETRIGMQLGQRDRRFAVNARTVTTGIERRRYPIRARGRARHRGLPPHLTLATNLPQRKTDDEHGADDQEGPAQLRHYRTHP